MTKITITHKDIKACPTKYCRIIVTEDKLGHQRLVETATGHLECRLGAGKWDKLDRRTFRTLVRTLVRSAKSQQIEHLALQLDRNSFSKLAEFGADWFFKTLAENLALAAYEFVKYKTKSKDTKNLLEILVCGVGEPAEKRSFSAGLTIAHATNLTRDIANTCGDDMTPASLANEARSILKGTKVSVRILDAAAIKKAGLGLLDAVGKGSRGGPRLIVMEYWGAGKPTKADNKDKKKAPIALIGKGITYDTGGLNVKPAGFMHEMHMDMTGGATVIGTLRAVSDLGLKKNVIGIIPAAENAISDQSMRAGDIVTSLSGQTVEILHTDAEGRLVLADAMTYAERNYQPKVMLDIATLTGASLVALGQHASAVLTKDESLQNALLTFGEETGDILWPLPLWDEYKQYLRGGRADISNIHTGFGRYGGCIEGGTFLSFFAPKDTPWAHIDIAPRMTSVPSDKLAKGATGEPVRLLVKFIEADVV